MEKAKSDKMCKYYNVLKYMALNKIIILVFFNVLKTRINSE